MHTTVTVPGKLIISGEHAVVYGNPALAAAIDRFVQVDFQSIDEPFVQFILSEYQETVRFSFPEFWQNVQHLKQQYEQFLLGNCPVSAITRHQYDLVIYTLGIFLQYAQKSMDQGFSISIQGNLPVGYGLGSSAAIIVGILKAASIWFVHPSSLECLQALAKQAENLQHGQSSGLDPSVCLYGGIMLYHSGQVIPRQLKPWSAYLINTGRSISSTGECVSWVKENSNIAKLLPTFKAVTLACDQALQQQDTQSLSKAIRENHRLLCEIGVVPARIQTYIAALEKEKMAAKICGAGSIIGDNAGYLLALGEDVESLKAITHEYKFKIEPVTLGISL